MRHVRVLAVALSFVAVTLFGGSVVVDRNSAGDANFDPAKSAAVFVGIRDFSYDTTLASVPYAVDDAVDLAYALSMNMSSKLVTPDRVLLALAGEPQKTESRARLDALMKQGAKTIGASGSDILVALEEQVAATEAGGVFIVSFATHGVSEGGSQYLVTATSLVRYPETTIRESRIRDIAAAARCGRSLIFIDACREKLTKNARNGEPDPRSKAAMIREMQNIRGQVVLSAAAANEYAYDDDRKKNGVFTAAVIEGIGCGSKRTSTGIVTAEALSDFVNAEVLECIQKHRDPAARKATQFTADGIAKLMPVAACGGRQ